MNSNTPLLSLGSSTSVMSSASSVIDRSLPKVTTKGAVLYTDGGAKPNPGYVGWGLHGYIYAKTPAKKGTGYSKGVITAQGYKDKGGEKSDITILQYIDGYGALKEWTTNNVGELKAAIYGLNYIRQLIESGEDIGDLFILADSEYVKVGITEHIHKWSVNGWKRADSTPIKNIELWQELYAAVCALEALSVNIDWEHVTAHNGDTGNSQADKYACGGVVAARKGYSLEGETKNIVLSDAGGYWTADIPKNRFLSYSRWYFNTGVGRMYSADGRNVYHVGKHHKDDEFEGMRQSDGRYAVLFVKDPIEHLESIRSYQDLLCAREGQQIVMGRLDNIYNRNVYGDIKRFGTAILDVGKNKPDLRTPEDPPTEITKIFFPPMKAQGTVNSLVVLQVILEDYLANCRNGTPGANGTVTAITDITALLYETDASKRVPVTKLRKEVDSALKALDVEINYNTGKESGAYSVPLTIDIDLPDRNTLSAIAETNPTVKVVSWPESSVAFRYAVIIENEADSGIWAAVYSNLRVLPK